MKHVALDLLLGRMVHCPKGARIGRIEEMQLGDEADVLEFLVGRQALLRRLSALGLIRRRLKGYRIRWDQIDISEPTRPRLTCPIEDLKPL